ncbi:MAG: tripartite tricarboxylate transporter TctB family protein [Comamonadaceae bacterium]|nr:tripartite tricarboxylate transporter TctB family protein [Comamonadaceae bacterium]
MKIKSQKDLFSGLLFMLTGGGFAWSATSYRIGTSASMGPGFFPLMLGGLLVLLGLLVVLRALAMGNEGGDKVSAWAWKPLFFVIVANLLFGVLLSGLPSFKVPAMGLVVAIFGLTLVAGMAGEQFKLKDSLLLASVLALVSYLTFIGVLKLQFQAWPAFITG